MTGTDTYLQIGCYGKLPFDRGYLESSISSPAATAWRRWIREGRRHVGIEQEEDDTPAHETASRWFAFALSGSSELLIGAIRPSRDQTPTRTHPFVVFTHVSRRSCSRRYALLPLELLRVWEALDDAWQSLARVSSTEAFQELLSATLVPPPLSAAQIESDYERRLEGDLGLLFDRSDGTSVEALLGSLPGAVLEVLDNERGARVELPVSPDPSRAAFETAFWLDLLSRHCPGRIPEPSLFIETGGEDKNRCVVFVFGMVTEYDYPLLMKIVGRESKSTRPAHAPVGVPSPALERSGPLTYADLLSRSLTS